MKLSAKQLAALGIGLTVMSTVLGAASVQEESTGASDRYIIETLDGTAHLVAGEVEQLGASPAHAFDDVIDGVAVELDSSVVDELRSHPAVLSIQIDHPVRIAAEQHDPPWGLDNIDQLSPLGDGVYRYPSAAGSGVRVYVFDTGVAPLSEFGGRVDPGYSVHVDGIGTNDCHGHGTRVAGTIAGETYGVAKESRIVPVRVMDCHGTGYDSDVIAGLDWVRATHPVGVPGILNLSIGGVRSAAVDAALESMIDAGFVAVAAAGNDRADACEVSPARVAGALTVAAIDEENRRLASSNFGSCVDVFAPGSRIATVSPDGTVSLSSGTSHAAPHVAGVAALAWSMNPTASGVEISQELLINTRSANVIDPGEGTPNRLLTSVYLLNADRDASYGRFVQQIYRDFLGREATTEEVESWSWLLAAGKRSRYDLAIELSRSDEWITTVITGFYQDTLLRQPDAAGLGGWVAAAQAGMPVAQIAAAFYSSPEYFESVGQGDHATWVADLYRKLLLREPDRAGLDGWVRALQAGMPRDVLSFGFYQSSETIGVRIDHLYERLLGRGPEAGAIPNWSPFVHNQGDLVLAAAIAGSAEYNDLAQIPH